MLWFRLKHNLKIASDPFLVHSNAAKVLYSIVTGMNSVIKPPNVAFSSKSEQKCSFNRWQATRVIGIQCFTTCDRTSHNAAKRSHSQDKSESRLAL